MKRKDQRKGGGKLGFFDLYCVIGYVISQPTPIKKKKKNDGMTYTAPDKNPQIEL